MILTDACRGAETKDHGLTVIYALVLVRLRILEVGKQAIGLVGFEKTVEDCSMGKAGLQHLL